MKIKHFIYLMLAAWSFLLTGSSCSESTDVEQTGKKVHVSVTLSADSRLQTRTTLPEYDGEPGVMMPGVQHVTDVYLYIYELDGQGDGTCVAMEDVKWSEMIERDENNKLPTTTAELTYFISYSFTVGKQYRLLAVGQDNAESEEEMPDYDGMNSGKTYDWPQVGSKLSEAFASLKQTVGVENIAHSEFFAGYLDFTPDEDMTPAGVIDLYRRVAGLQVCFSKIPTDIERVRVLLYRSQNTQVPLIPKTASDGSFADFIDSPYGADISNPDGRVILDVPEEGMVLEEPVGGSGMVSEPYKKLTATAFLLPIAAPDKQQYTYTLVAEFMTTTITGIVGESKRIRLVSNGNGDLVFDDESDIGTGIIDNLDKYLYPIQANHLYCVGTPSVPIDCSVIGQY